MCVYPPLGERFSSTGSTVGGVLEKSAEAGDLCVSTPGKRAPFTISIKQGGNARLTDIAQRRRCQFVVKQCGTPHCVPAEFSPCCDSTFHVFGSWFFMILPQNLPFAAFVLQLGRADRSCSRLDQQLVETPTSLSDSSPCRSIAFLPIETIALTENPSSKCVGRGTVGRATKIVRIAQRVVFASFILSDAARFVKQYC